MQTSILINQKLLLKSEKTLNFVIFIKFSNLGPLAKLDKALGYEPGDSRFEFWAVHQKGNKKC